jgi:hypothetical protein
MATWSEFAAQAPNIAEGGRNLIYRLGVPLGYLATVRKDSGLRIHPVCPIVFERDLWLLIGNHSPKKWDLLRDGRYALHAFPVDNDDEFMVAGRAEHTPDHALEERVTEALVATGATSADHSLFRLSIERALLSLYEPRPGGGGIWPPQYHRWQDRA